MTPIYLAIIVVLVPLLIAGMSLAPWVPMNKKDLARIDSLSDLKSGQVFYELGCGDARVCHYIAKKNPQAQVIGVERALPMYLVSRFILSMKPLPNLKIVFGDALKTDLSKADVVYTFAMIKSLNYKLKKKFLAEMKKGSKIVSYVFSMKEWEGEKVIDEVSDKRRGTINVYML